MIHKTAIVDSRAKVSSSVKIGAYSVIGPDVEIGDNTIIHSQVNISGNTIIGNGNKIYPFAAIGNDPQDLKYNGEETKLVYLKKIHIIRKLITKIINIKNILHNIIETFKIRKYFKWS